MPDKDHHPRPKDDRAAGGVVPNKGDEDAPVDQDKRRTYRYPDGEPYKA